MPTTPKAPKITPEEQALVDYIALGTAYGCCPEQIRNFFIAGTLLQPKQLEFAALCRQCDVPNGPESIMYSGGRGSAKSHGFFAQIGEDDCQRFPGLNCLILRKVGSANKEQLEEFLSKLFVGLRFKYKAQSGLVVFENGSKIRIGHFKDEKDIGRYLGLEYDLIGIEEANQLSGTKIKNILSCLRTSKPGWRPRSYLTTNPGGIGHGENKKIYYDPFNAGTQTRTRLVHTLVYDNKFVNPEYVDYLESLTGWQLQAWLYGSWELMAGAFFTNWNDLWHVYPNPHVRNTPQNIVRWKAGYDYSYSHPACFTLIGDDALGNSYVIDQFHENEMVIKEQAVAIKDLLKANHVELWNLEYIAAGGDCFSKGKDGRTVAQDFEAEGIDLVDAQVDRINFNAVVQQRLGQVSRGIEPTVFIHNRCLHLIEQIPILQHHETKAGDVVKMNANERGEGGDDAYESFRNGICFGAGTACSFAVPVQIGGYQPIQIRIGQ